MLTHHRLCPVWTQAVIYHLELVSEEENEQQELTKCVCNRNEFFNDYKLNKNYPSSSTRSCKLLTATALLATGGGVWSPGASAAVEEQR